MLSAVLILFGMISYERIGVDRLPAIDFPMLSVVTALPGANPEVVDASVTNIIESSVNSVSGIESIQSSSLPQRPQTTQRLFGSSVPPYRLGVLWNRRAFLVSPSIRSSLDR